MSASDSHIVDALQLAFNAAVYHPDGREAHRSRVVFHLTETGDWICNVIRDGHSVKFARASDPLVALDEIAGYLTEINEAAHAAGEAA